MPALCLCQLSLPVGMLAFAAALAVFTKFSLGGVFPARQQEQGVQPSPSVTPLAQVVFCPWVSPPIRAKVPGSAPVNAAN